ncbi:MAG: hypothetical protein HEEMFOPI_00390 [Holosporales bacterium]
MKNLFLVYKKIDQYKEYFIYGIGIFFNIILMIGLFRTPFFYVGFLPIICFAYGIYLEYKMRQKFCEFKRVCENLKKGDFETRLVLPYEPFYIKEFVDKFNNVLDVCDAFVRESSLAMKAVSEERFHRKILQEGFSGAYIVALKRINSSIDIIKEKTHQEKMLKDAIDKVNEHVSVGNLDIQLSSDGFSKTYEPLIHGLNRVMMTVSKPIQESIQALKLMSEGDFTYVMEGDYQGDFEELKLTFEKTVIDLSNIIKGVNSISYSVHQSAQEIVHSAGEIAEKTEAQASALEETAASIEELASTVRQNSENASESDKLARSAQELVVSAHSVMDNTVTSIKSIKTSAEKIENIIEFLDDISFQTNMLALNATIEAARAGSSGRGFAVVAQEVRSLAKKSADASTEMKQLLQNSHSDIEQGVTLILKTNDNLNKILGSVKTVSAMIADIANASIEQATGIEQINIAVNQLDEVTQLNSSAVNANFATTASLNSSAEKLKSMVQRFKLR